MKKEVIKVVIALILFLISLIIPFENAGLILEYILLVI